MRLIAVTILSCLLGLVYWLGATVYSEKIEQDIATRTQPAIDEHRSEISDISRKVDGRDVRVLGTTHTESARDAAGDTARDVWGTRVVENQIAVVEAKAPDPASLIPIPAPEPEPEPVEEPEAIGFDLHAQHRYPDLTMSGLVDDAAFDTASNIHLALPPESLLDRSGLSVGSDDLYLSPRKLETGIAAVTQLNPGTLRITDTQFILEGSVASADREKTVRQLIDTRLSDLEPLEVIVNISVVESAVPVECLQQLNLVLADNVLNYAVNHYRILDTHRSVLDAIAYTVNGPCKNHIKNVLVEGHADITGSDGYNQGLSERRSGTVKDYLLNNGIDDSLISAHGYGEFRPIASNDTEFGRSQNRRTEIYLLTFEGAYSQQPDTQLSNFSDQ